MEISAGKKYAAEALGTFVLTLFGCGSAAIAGATLGTLGIAFAFGLSIVCMAFAIGNISGCHINPAVSLGVFLDAAVLRLIVHTCDRGGALQTGLGCNGFDDASTVGLGMFGAVLVEIILTCFFVLTILGVTADEKASPFAGIVIGLTLTFVHIMGIPLTGTSVNPARSFGPAVMMATQGDMTALSQVWVFIAAPLVGAALAALIYRALYRNNQ